MAGPTHYRVLGVTAEASNDEIHRAYLQAARTHHPDRNAGSDESAASMARVNEAWRVLGHPGRRRQYDRELRGETPYLGGSSSATASSYQPGSHLADDAELDDPDLVDVAGGHPLFGFLPGFLLFGALVIIFIFTAYAATGGGSADADDPSAGSRLGECVVITSGRPTIAAIDCAVGNDGQVVAEVDVNAGERCPADTAELQLPAERLALCLAG